MSIPVQHPASIIQSQAGNAEVPHRWNPTETPSGYALADQISFVCSVVNGCLWKNDSCTLGTGKWMKMDMKPLSIYDKYWFNYCRSLENWWITYLLRMVIFHDSPHLSQFTSWYLFFEEWFSIGIDPWLISKPKKPSNLTHQLKGHHDPPPNG